ncbi:MAG: hypothetical protein ACYCTG_00830 [Ferrimicrobium sp.]
MNEVTTPEPEYVFGPHAMIGPLPEDMRVETCELPGALAMALETVDMAHATDPQIGRTVATLCKDNPMLIIELLINADEPSQSLVLSIEDAAMQVHDQELYESSSEFPSPGPIEF